MCVHTYVRTRAPMSGCMHMHVCVRIHVSVYICQASHAFWYTFISLALVSTPVGTSGISEGMPWL